MEKPVTLGALARHLDVHPSTISLALRNSPEVSKAMCERVHALARRWKYSPNHIARSLRQRSTHTLGVLFPYTTEPHYATLLDALDAEADSRGLHLEVHFHQWSARQEASALRTMVERRVDGLIVMPAAASSFKTLGETVPSSMGFPIVISGIYRGMKMPACVRGRVATDFVAGGRMLAEHLLSLGHRRIAFLIANRREDAERTDRVAGLRSAIGKCAGAELSFVCLTDEEDALRRSSVNSEGGMNAALAFELAKAVSERFLQLDPRPTVAVATGESLAHVLMSVLHGNGLRIPDAVSVACFDGTFLSAYGMMPLTCVAHPYPELARSLIELVAADSSRGQSQKQQPRLLAPLFYSRASVARVNE